MVSKFVKKLKNFTNSLLMLTQSLRLEIDEQIEILLFFLFSRTDNPNRQPKTQNHRTEHPACQILQDGTR